MQYSAEYTVAHVLREVDGERDELGRGVEVILRGGVMLEGRAHLSVAHVLREIDGERDELGRRVEVVHHEDVLEDPGDDARVGEHGLALVVHADVVQQRHRHVAEERVAHQLHHLRR
eukprot:4924724-Pyramimonas_sp.AAC.2